ncbi:MAG: C45 family autoproteolytic acyltransferase/hydrolase [Brevibacterium sp.]
MSAEYIPAARVRPEVFTSRAADHIRRGLQRGHDLSTGIRSAIAGYRRYFAHLTIAEADVRTAAATSLARLEEWAPSATEEISAVADGAGVATLDLMEVIARTEIMTLAPAAPTECSTVSLSRPGASVSAQTWDWMADYSTLWHYNDVGAVPGQLRHVGIAEYGMLGKIGLNEAGIGVHLNILKHEGDRPGGVPIHAILERVLATAHTLPEALEIIRSATTTSSSIITVVGADEVVQVEIANAQKRELRAGSGAAGFLVHTNHFLHPELVPGGLELKPDSTSRARFDHLERKVAEAELSSEFGTADLVRLLTTGPDEAPVCCIPDPDAPYGDRSATLVTVQIDPVRKRIDLAPGSPADGLEGNRSFEL